VVLLKVLHVYKDYYPPVKGGIECHINLLANGLKAKGVDVEILVSNTTNKYAEEIHNGIKVVKAPQFKRCYSAPLAPTFNFYLRKFGKTADIIHFHHPNPTAEFAYFFTNLNKKLIVTYHSDIIRQDKLGKLYSPFRKSFLELSDRIIATSPNYIETSNVLKHLKNKCTVIPLGVNIDRFCQDGDREKVEKIRNKNGNQPIILFVGCFRYYKGLQFLISAMKRIQAKLFLIGAGPEEQNLRNIVAMNHLNKKVHFLGELPDDEVNAYYKACDIFVLPSQLRSEAFGMVQLEAMCCGKPVISTELGTGTSFVNLDQQTGLVVRPNDSESLSLAIGFLINNPLKRKTLGDCGSKRVRQLFTAKKMVNSTLNLYEAVIAKRVTPALKPEINDQGDIENTNQNTNVLRVVSRLNIGGPSIHCAILTKGFRKTPFNSKLLIGKTSPHEGDMSYLINGANGFILKVPDLQREINIIKDIRAFYKILKIVFKEQPDIVHTHLAKAGALSRAAVFIHNLVSQKKIKTVHTFHGNVLTGYFNPLQSQIFIKVEKILAKVTDAIIAISQTQKWELTQKFKLTNDSKVHIINLGFDLTRFSKNNGQGKLRSNLDVDDKSLLIGIIGRLVPIKNHKLFLDSAKLILNVNPDKNILFIVIGDGELREELETYSKQIGIADDVVFYGWEKEIQKIYADLDMLLLTSNNEGTPVSIIESMASCVPVVTTGVGGVKDLLGRINKKSHAKNECSICERGILCPKGSADAIAEGVQYLIENKDDSLVTKARDFVLNNYSDVRLIEKITKLYQNL
jgi:glycosyltransferase involved in cell wall biosynthesis